MDRRLVAAAGRRAPLLYVGMILALVGMASPVEGGELTGTVTYVRDGDTIEVDRVPVRLQGLNAPEMSAPLGRASKSFMQEMVLQKRVRCELDGSRAQDRVVGVCFLDGRDIAIDLVQAGLGTDCPRYSGGRYAEFTLDRAKQQIALPDYCR